MTKIRRAILAVGVIAAVLSAPSISSAQTGGQIVETAYGKASWYGLELHGRLTASGDVFDAYGLTAAHPTLPFGTRVRVTNVANGKSVIVSINDRGPFAGNRIVDLSREAAKAIGMIRSGAARVKIEVLKRT